MPRNRPLILPQTLQEAIILQAVDDYRKALGEGDLDVQRDCERFFRSKWFTTLTDIDGPTLLERLIIENPMPKEKTAMPKPNTNPTPKDKEIEDLNCLLEIAEAKLKKLEEELSRTVRELSNQKMENRKLCSENDQLQNSQTGGTVALKAKLFDYVMKELEDSHADFRR